MAWNSTGPNLNTVGGGGNFETDPSTWGMILNASGQFQLSRSYDEKFFGNYSCQSQNKAAAFDGGNRNTGAVASGSLGADLYYRVSAWVKVSSAAPSASNDAILQIFSNNGLTEVVAERETTTVSAAKSGFVEISAIFQNSDTAGNRTFSVRIVDAGSSSLNVDGLLWVDRYFIRNTIDETDPCTLAIDSATTIATAETTPGAEDGTITIGITGGTAPFEYSADGGDTWQDSNLFTGLAPGSYSIRVREKNRISCTSFSQRYVNSASPDFSFTMSITHETISGAANGAIVVTPTGIYASPLEFSKDGGDTWQGSNSFLNLAPGEYVIAVRDNDGFIVTELAIVNPGEVIFERVYFHKNHIIFTVPKLVTTPGENYRSYLEVRVQHTPGGTFQKTMAMAVELNSENVSVFNLRQALRGVLHATPPAHNENTIKRITDRIKLYKVFYKYTEEDALEPSGSLNESNPFYVALGGIDKKKYPETDYFGNYIPTNKKFMTWQPPMKGVDLAQEDYLQFWVYHLDITQLKLMATAYYDDETTATEELMNLTGVVYGGMYQVPAGPFNTGVLAIDSEKNLVRYDLWLRDQDDEDVSEVRSYMITQTTPPNTRYFMFLTSLGAYEVIRTTGIAERTVEFQNEIIEKHLTEDYSATDGQFQSGDKTLQARSRYSSGWITGRYAQLWLEYMQDFMLSNQVYEITGGQRVPVIIQSRSMPLKPDRDNKRFVRFEVIEAYNEHSYTPALI